MSRPNFAKASLGEASGTMTRLVDSGVIMNQDYKPIIGIEIHVELKTNSKMFCRCSADYFGQKPNTHTCPVCLGLPGALPVPNQKAIEWCIKLGLALSCEIPLNAKFDRKNYFYPDLPKGYQISQYDEPFCKNGRLDIKSEIRNPKSETNLKSKIPNSKRIRIRRVHLEEDTAKLTHQLGISKFQTPNPKNEKFTLIDFNRSGVPLVEIVTEPDISSSEEAKVFLQELHRIVRYLGISDADMEKGSMRLEPNISLLLSSRSASWRSGDLNGIASSPSAPCNDLELPKYKVEVKNINSFNFAKKAIDYEIERHIEILESGATPLQETRGWNETKGITYSQRSKEEAHDYRYFPEPDIPPFVWKQEYIELLKKNLPGMPRDKRAKYLKMGIKEADCGILVDLIDAGNFFEEAIKVSSTLNKDIKAQEIANWIVNSKVDITKDTPLKLIEKIIAKKDSIVIDEKSLNLVINEVISQNPQGVSDYKKGKQSAVMFLVGQVMRKTKGKGDPQKLKMILEEKIK